MFAAHISVGANSSRVHRTIAFSLVTHAGTSSFTGYFYIGMAANSTAPAPTTTVPPATTTTTSGSAEANYPQNSPNWSGYAVTGGKFTAVEGTFIIPTITTNATCTEAVSDWVGIDGMNASNLPTDTNLIQAGIGESMTNPATGSCTNGTFWFWAWWEILPAAETPVDISMSQGDSVTLTIGLAQDGNYGIVIQDNTDGQEFDIEQPYDGRGASVEWIGEAPVIPSLCSTGEDPSFVAGICQLAPFQPVNFTTLKLTGTQNALYEIDMVQNGTQVAAPTDLSGGAFTDNYTGPSGALSQPALERVGKDVTGKFLHPIYEGER